MKKNKSIRFKLILSFLGILLIPTLLIGWLSYDSAKKQIMTQQQQYAQTSINILNSNVTNAITSKIHEIDFLAERIDRDMLKMNKNAVIRNVLGDYISSHKDVELAYVGTAEGDMIRMPYFIYDKSYNPTTRPWYKGAFASDSYSISDPYISEDTGDLTITISKKLSDSSGIIGIDMSLQQFDTLANEVKIGKKGYISIVDKAGNYISHPHSDAGSSAPENLKKILSSNREATIEDEKFYTSAITNNSTDWHLIGVTYKSEGQAIANKTLQTNIILIIISLLVGSVVVLIVIRAIITPLKRLRDHAIEISNGNLTVPITIHSTDEIGDLAQAFDQMKNNLADVLRNMKDATTTVQASAQLLASSAEQNIAASQQITSAMEHVTVGTETQMTNIDQSNQAIDEMAQGVSGIANDASKVTVLSQTAREQALDGGKAIDHTVLQMRSIHEAVNNTDQKIRGLYDRTKEIGTILEMIRTIADQTNLLALNASIEAARAGEHGKGFAVVAEEVRKLAESSQQSARQIDDLIAAVQQDTGATVEIMKNTISSVQQGTAIATETADKFAAIITSMKDITPRMENMSATSEEMAATIHEVSTNVQMLSDIAKDNAASSEQVSASTEESLSSMENMSSTAQELLAMSEHVNAIIRQFKL